MFWIALAFAKMPVELKNPLALTLTVDPLTSVLGHLHLQAEFALGNRSFPPFSLYVGPNIRPPLGPDSPQTHLGLELGLRTFLPVWRQPGLRGTWFMARTNVGAVSHAGNTRVPSGWVSGLLGATWAPRERTDQQKKRWRLVLSGGAGLQYINTSVGSFGSRGVFPALHTNIGIGR